MGASHWKGFLLRGWLIAGTLDILWATGISAWRGVAPSRVLQFVASGALGPPSYEGGLATAAVGLAFHYLNAFLFTAFFFAVAARVPALVRAPFLTGPAYGVFIYLVMNKVVVPLSLIGPRPTPPASRWVPELLVHMFFIGLTIAVAARKAFPPQAA